MKCALPIDLGTLKVYASFLCAWTRTFNYDETGAIGRSLIAVLDRVHRLTVQSMSQYAGGLKNLTETEKNIFDLVNI